MALTRSPSVAAARTRSEIPRRRLLRQLTPEGEPRVVLCAPAGDGKTGLARQMCEHPGGTTPLLARAAGRDVTIRGRLVDRCRRTPLTLIVSPAGFRFPGRVAAAVAQETTADVILRDLGRRTSLVSAIDRGRFEYHPVLRHALRHHLARLEPGTETGLDVRAANAWLDAPSSFDSSQVVVCLSGRMR